MKKHNLFFIIFLTIFLVQTINALEVTISCPSEVSELSEFECSVNVHEFEENIDVKIDIFGNSNRISQIWVGDKWQRSDWFYKNIVQSSGETKIKMKLHKSFVGTGEITFKIRKSSSEGDLSKKLTSTTQQIYIKDNSEAKEETSNETKNQEEEDENEENDEEIESTQNTPTKQIVTPDKTESTESIIKLTKQKEANKEQTEKVVYKSKTEIIRKYSIPFFSILLIVIIFLIIKK